MSFNALRGLISHIFISLITISLSYSRSNIHNRRSTGTSLVSMHFFRKPINSNLFIIEANSTLNLYFMLLIRYSVTVLTDGSFQRMSWNSRNDSSFSGCIGYTLTTYQFLIVLMGQILIIGQVLLIGQMLLIGQILLIGHCCCSGICIIYYYFIR